MKIMVLWTVIGAVVGYFVIYYLFGTLAGDMRADFGTKAFFSLTNGAIPMAAIGAIFAGVSVIQTELRETRREWKHWLSIHRLDIELDKPSTQFESAPPSGMQ